MKIADKPGVMQIQTDGTFRGKRVGDLAPAEAAEIAGTLEKRWARMRDPYVKNFRDYLLGLTFTGVLLDLDGDLAVFRRPDTPERWFVGAADDPVAVDQALVNGKP